IISDHGFEDKGTPVLAKVSDANFSKRRYWHRKEGFIFAYGDGVRPGKILGATVFDIAPTVLAYYRLPVAKNMRGRPLENIVSGPYERTDTYESLDNRLSQRAYARFLFNKVSDLGYTQSRK